MPRRRHRYLDGFLKCNSDSWNSQPHREIKSFFRSRNFEGWFLVLVIHEIYFPMSITTGYMQTVCAGCDTYLDLQDKSNSHINGALAHKLCAKTAERTGGGVFEHGTRNVKTGKRQRKEEYVSYKQLFEEAMFEMVSERKEIVKDIRGTLRYFDFSKIPVAGYQFQCLIDRVEKGECEDNNKILKR